MTGFSIDTTGALTAAPSLILPDAPAIDGKSSDAGDVGRVRVSNAEFIAALFQNVPPGAYAAVCSKPGDPANGGWPASRANNLPELLPATNNNYVNCSTFHQDGLSPFKTNKANFAACHCLVLDDVGTKVPLDRVKNVPFSWKLETSPGNFQIGFIFKDPVTDGDVANELLNEIIASGLCDEGALQPMTRWVRLPEGINGKPQHSDPDGNPFKCRLTDWHPERRYTPQELAALLGVPAAIEGRTAMPLTRKPVASHVQQIGNDVLAPKAIENPVLPLLKARGLYKFPMGSGEHAISCPWVAEHPQQGDSNAVYHEPDTHYGHGRFCCEQSHSIERTAYDLVSLLDVDPTVARHKPTVTIAAGELNRIVEAAEILLAQTGRIFQCGGLIVAVATDPATGDPAIVAISAPALTRELSIAATWLKFDKHSGNWNEADPSSRHVSILYESQQYAHLPALTGLARQPFFRVTDGTLVMMPGYDNVSKRFGVFDPTQFPLGDATPEAARAALAELRQLLAEFRYVAPVDEAAAISGMFTAVVRPSLPVAPAFHSRASVFGSGKSFQCELISLFAGPGASVKISYPKTSEEATKVILAVLLGAPACVEFDDMDGDWHPHGVINRMLTAEKISDRILGVSKTATVSTQTLVLGSGNNVGPIRDTLRRVITIHIDPRVETPATITYRGDPVTKVKANRGYFVMLIITVIQAWRAAGCPRTDVDSIASYGGVWADYCRHPLIWLGLPDPATSLIEQLKHDPDADSLKGLMTEWRKAYGSSPITVRTAVDSRNRDLLDAIREFPVEDRGEINRAKLGWILKKNANRVVGGFEFQRATADGRTAWRVVAVRAPSTPSSTDDVVIEL